MTSEIKNRCRTCEVVAELEGFSCMLHDDCSVAEIAMSIPDEVFDELEKVLREAEMTPSSME